MMRAPSTSISLVAEPRHVSTISASPTPTMRSPLIATARARGRASSNVSTLPFVRITSAGAAIVLACSRVPREQAAYEQHEKPVEDETECSEQNQSNEHDIDSKQLMSHGHHVGDPCSRTG